MMKRMMAKSLLTLGLVLAVTVCGWAGDITDKGYSQKDIYTFLSNVVTQFNALKLQACTLTHPNVHKNAAGAATVDIGTTFTYALDGLLYSKTASDTIASVTGAVQATGTTCYYLLSVDSTGSVTTTKGTAVTFGSTPTVPTLPASNAPFGLIKIAITTTATGSFTLGTTAFNTITGVTETFYNVGRMPSGASAITALSLSGL